MKKVSEAEKRDRSAAAVPGAAASAPTDGASAPPPASGGGLADALAAALSQRNKKVSASGKSCHSFVLSVSLTVDYYR